MRATPIASETEFKSQFEALLGVVSPRINKPTLDWPSAAELAEKVARAIIQPK